MRAPAGSLLEATSRLVVGRQIAFANKQRLPWGVSESAYNARDLELTYQYSNFGIPGLGLKRGLADNFVVAPYATGLAAMVDPAAARANLERLAGVGALGRYGFYEALDYTPDTCAGRRTARHRARFHGPPSGHDHRRHRQCHARRQNAGAVSRRADGAGDRTAVAGAHAARRRRHPSLGGGNEILRQKGARRRTIWAADVIPPRIRRPRRRTCFPTGFIPRC